MFTFSADHNSKNKTILLTGDSTGDVLDDALHQPTNPRSWDIMKVMHHGSSRNSILRTGQPIPDAVAAFFIKYQADKYVISADTWNKSPNPDVCCLEGIVTALEKQSKLKRVYITNGCSLEG